MAVWLKQKWQLILFNSLKHFHCRGGLLFTSDKLYLLQGACTGIAAILLSIVLIFLLWILKISATVHEEHWNFNSIFWKPSNLTLKSLKHPYSPLKQTWKIVSVLADQLSGQSQNPCTAWSRCSEYKIECEFIIHCSA